MISLIDDNNIAQVRAALPTPPYYAFLASHQAMANLLSTVVPRMHDAFVSSDLEWYSLYLSSQAANFISERFINSLVHTTAINSRAMIHSDINERFFLYCASYHDASYLPTLAAYTRAADSSSYATTCMLVDRAFKHSDRKLLSLAVDRLSFYDPRMVDSGHPLLEYEVALARYNFLCGKTIDVDKLLKQIHEQGNKYHKRIYIHELCSFLPLNHTDVALMAAIAAQGPEQELEQAPPELLEFKPSGNRGVMQ